MGHARAAIMADQEKPLMAELFHHFDHVFGHHAMAVIDELVAGLGQRGIAIAPEIGTHHVIVLRELCRDRVPKHVIVRIAMKQQQRRPRTAMAQANDGALGAHIDMLEAGEQSRNLRAAPARGITRIIGGRRFGQNGRRFAPTRAQRGPRLRRPRRRRPPVASGDGGSVLLGGHWVIWSARSFQLLAF